jgi:hypothetical protein
MMSDDSIAALACPPCTKRCNTSSCNREGIGLAVCVNVCTTPPTPRAFQTPPSQPWPPLFPPHPPPGKHLVFLYLPHDQLSELRQQIVLLRREFVVRDHVYDAKRAIAVAVEGGDQRAAGVEADVGGVSDERVR